VNIRDVISRRKRKATIIQYAGFTLFVFGGLATSLNESLFVLALPGFAIFIGGILFMLFRIRCPRCRGNIGYAVSYYGGPFTVSPKIRFCPFCGVALDSQYDETQKGNKSL